MPNEWISVKDRLPEESGEYFVFTDSEQYMVLFYSQEHKKFNAFDGQPKRVVEDCAIEVSHWRPLPEKPKEGADNAE